jgi:hypothetical protein
MRFSPSLALALTLVSGTSLPAAADQTTTVLEASVLHDGPAARYRRLGVIERDQQATVKGCNKSGRWCEIEAGDKHGWVMSSHLKITDTASAPAEKQSAKPPGKSQNAPPAEAKTEPPPSVIVETEKAGKGDKLAAPGKPVVIVIKSADGKVSSTMTVAAGSNVVVTASGRSRCELKAAVNP